MKIYILAGGNSYEREVSLSSAEEIFKHLDKNKYDAEILEIPNNHSNKWIETLLNSPPDIVLSALHGGIGEGGQVQGLLECMGIPYIGSKVMSSSICLNKHLSKNIMRFNNIPVLDDVLIKTLNDLVTYENIIYDMEYPLVVKPNMGGSSVGVSIVNDFDELKNAVNEIFKLKDYALIEKYIKGNEIACGMIEKDDHIEILPVLDIETNRDFYDYSAKYVDEDTGIKFSLLPEFQQSMIREIARKVFITLNCEGYGRVDMIVYDEQIVVLEMNTLPGLTSHSLVPKSVQGKGRSFSQFLDEIIEFEMKKQ